MKVKHIRKRNISLLIAKLGFLAIFLATAFYLIHSHNLLVILKEYLESNINPVFFLLLMLILPIVGVPLSFFLVLVGMKFGTAEGVLLSAAVMLFHMAATYFLIHSFLRKWIYALLKFFHIPVPEIKGDHNKWHAFIFMLIPGLPYAVKNNLLAMTGMPLLPYLTINWVAQFGLSIPLIILGSAVMEMNLAILGIALALLLAAYLLQYFLRKKYRKTIIPEETPGNAGT
ncbi:TVP38/TMEM64 family protein [Desulfopila inferna]|uniref:TVP38/TMEM64 family protein n=1 Tax=Desulfopila inferna TaxID=468528 RepID=UPI001962A044|nr:hypothetical protein [Desulfopila inferna]MBM9604965.1 hypothetical protein [Desulfopila inferna]